MSTVVPFAAQLVPIQYYTQSDPYYYTVDNRPLQNIGTQTSQLANELDRRTQAVDIVGSATPTVTNIPSGWTYARTAAGTYTITHNIGNTNYIVTGSVISTTAAVIYIYSKSTTTIEIVTCTLAGTATDMEFQLLITGY